MEETTKIGTTEQRRAVLIAALFLTLGFLIAKNSIHPEVVTKTEIQEKVRTQTQVHWRTVETKKPDGTVVIETIADSDTKSISERKEKTETKISSLSRYRLGLRYRTEKMIVPAGPELDVGARLGNLPLFINGSVNQQLGFTLGISIDL